MKLSQKVLKNDLLETTSFFILYKHKRIVPVRNLVVITYLYQKEVDRKIATQLSFGQPLFIHDITRAIKLPLS